MKILGNVKIEMDPGKAAKFSECTFRDNETTIKGVILFMNETKLQTCL